MCACVCVDVCVCVRILVRVCMRARAYRFVYILVSASRILILHAFSSSECLPAVCCARFAAGDKRKNALSPFPPAQRDTAALSANTDCVGRSRRNRISFWRSPPPPPPPQAAVVVVSPIRIASIYVFRFKIVRVRSMPRVGTNSVDISVSNRPGAFDASSRY